MITVIQSVGADQSLTSSLKYGYSIKQLDGRMDFSKDSETTVYLYRGIASTGGLTLDEGDSIEINGRDITLEGKGTLLVASVPFAASNDFARITRAGAHYKVEKPWGYELWLNGDHPRYCFKKIFVKYGTQTSLQYHNFKEETNFIIEGTAVLVSNNTGVPNESVTDADLLERTLEAPACLDVPAKDLHRLRAITNILLFEVSTPYLDDVIRIQDDTLRNNGRIEAEHAKNSVSSNGGNGLSNGQVLPGDKQIPATNQGSSDHITHHQPVSGGYSVRGSSGIQEGAGDILPPASSP